MYYLLFILLFFTTQGVFAQCDLVAPDSLRTSPHYQTIYEGDTVTFTTYGGHADSTSWFALYGEECCVTRLDSNKTGVFTFVIWSSDIFYSRIESYCDTTWGASIDVEVWLRVTGIQPLPAAGAVHPLLQGEGPEQQPYDLLGRKIVGEPRGFFIIKKRLFFK